MNFRKFRLCLLRPLVFWYPNSKLYTDEQFTTGLLLLFNLLNPTGHVLHQQFNIQQLYPLPTLYLYVLYLSENKQRLVPLTDKLIGFYNRDEKCLPRATNWVFK